MTQLALNVKLARSCRPNGNRCNHLANKSVLKDLRVSTGPRVHLDLPEVKVNADCQACQVLRDFPDLPESKETRVSPEFRDHWASADLRVWLDHPDHAVNRDHPEAKAIRVNQVKMDPKVNVVTRVCLDLEVPSVNADLLVPLVIFRL